MFTYLKIWEDGMGGGETGEDRIESDEEEEEDRFEGAGQGVKESMVSTQVCNRREEVTYFARDRK